MESITGTIKQSKKHLMDDINRPPPKIVTRNNGRTHKMLVFLSVYARKVEESCYLRLSGPLPTTPFH